MHLTPQQRNHYKKQGFVVVPNLNPLFDAATENKKLEDQIAKSI